MAVKNVFVIFSCSIILVLRMQTGPSNCWLRCRGGWYQCHCVSWRRRTYCLALEPKKPLLQPDWSHNINWWILCTISEIFNAVYNYYCTHILYRICIKCCVQSCILQQFMSTDKERDARIASPQLRFHWDSYNIHNTYRGGLKIKGQKKETMN